MEIFRFSEGAAPLLVSIPHCGTSVSDDLAARMTPEALALPDTDWHVDRLYDFAVGLGASVLAATHSRYVIDLNRSSDNAPLYPGADNTGLCPTTTFAREPIYRAGQEPDAAEVSRRVGSFWRPFHERLEAEIARIRGSHGFALLFDAHSIRSEVPRFFAGRLADLNLGTADGASADAGLVARLEAIGRGADGYTSVLNGRFKGGYITRSYGRPAAGVHAVQLELSEITYMDEDPPYAWREDRAMRIRPVLRSLLEAMLAWGADL